MATSSGAGRGNENWGVVSVSSLYTVGTTDAIILADAGSGAFNVHLPPVAANANRIIVIKKIDASGNQVTVDPQDLTTRLTGQTGTVDSVTGLSMMAGRGQAGDPLLITIDGATTQPLSNQWDSIMVVSNGTHWFII